MPLEPGMPGGGYGFWLEAGAIEPLDDMTWLAASETMQGLFWAQARRVAADQWDASRARGVDRQGRRLRSITAKTRKYRRSAMGQADPSAPPLIPAHELSRTRSFLRSKTIRGRGAWFYFRHDPRVKGSWGKILWYHATGQAPGGKVRDVLGFSPIEVRTIRRIMRKWWHERRPRVVVEQDRLKVVGSPPVDLPRPRIVQTARGRILEGEGIRFNIDEVTMGVGSGNFERAEFVGDFRNRRLNRPGGTAPAPRPARPRPPVRPVAVARPPAPSRVERVQVLTPSQAEVARSLGVRAARSLAAFMAAVEKLLREGKDVPREALALYFELGGKLP